MPSEWGDLVNLASLDLSFNSLSGIIPSQLSNLTSLTNLDLSYNSLSSTLPSELSVLTSLTKANFVRLCILVDVGMFYSGPFALFYAISEQIICTLGGYMQQPL